MEETIQEFGLRATFLLDTYLGHRSDGSREPFPDAARLHAALTNAACCGSTAQVSEDGSSLIPHPQAVESLRWLDEHEPVEMELPQSSPLGTGEEFAYRNVSSVNAKHSAEKRLISDGAGLSGPVGYIWKDVPRNVAQWLDLLAADVGCLGEATSPVIIRTGATATHRRAREQTIFARGGERFRVPRAGRTDELMKRHGEANPKKKPTVAADKLKQGELPKPSRISQECVRSSRYVPIVAGRAPADDLSVPWSSVYVVPLSGDNVQPEDRMAWAAALHKALIAAVGENVSSLLTGKYPEGSPRPANGLAVHCVPSERVAHLGIEQPALLIMSPACAQPADLIQVEEALSQVKRLWFRNSVSRKLIQSQKRVISADEFWPAKPAGYKRLWATDPVIIPEIRRPRNDRNKKPWTLAQAGMLSAAFVWRNSLKASGRGETYYRSLASAAYEKGVRVHEAQLTTSQNEKYVHRLPEAITAQPYRAIFDLGDLITSDRTLFALGQSRHFSGGLMIPVDIPTEFSTTLKEDRK